MGYNDRGFNNKGSGGRPGGYNRGRDEMVNLTFPPGYLQNAYLNDKGERDVRYITAYAESVGKSLSTDPNTGKSKIRSYFDAVNSIKDTLYGKIVTEEQAIIKLAQLKPRVMDRLAKGNASKFFSDFINKNIDIVIQDQEHFKDRLLHFRDHFEAVVCYTADKKDKN